MRIILLLISPRMKKPSKHWWQNVLSISSSSKSDDSISGNRHSPKSSLFTRSRRKSSRSVRLYKQSRKFRHEPEIGFWTNSKESPARSVSNSESTLPAPQPLPLPDLGPLFRRDTKFPSHRSNPDNLPLPLPDNLPLPSPREQPLVGDKGRKKAKNLNVDVNNALERRRKSRSSSEVLECLSRMAIRESEKSMENSDTSRRSPQKLIGIGLGRNPYDYHMNFTNSAPTSPLPSPQILNRDTSTFQFVTPPGIFQVWSAPELPSPDSVKCYGSSVKYPYDVSSQGVDNPSIHSYSPKLIPHQNCRNSNGPASPLPNKLVSENQIASRDNSNCQSNVHPLPLPPGGGSTNPLQQHIPTTPIFTKPDLLPIKSQWQKGKLLGRGTFGSVYVASNTETGALCAMKEVEILQDDPKSAECIKQLEQEIEVLSQLKHPNIVQYYGSERVGDRFHIYLEYVHPGSINNFIRDHCGEITESVVRNFTRHILSGLAYLHGTKTIHRDIKGANLLVDAYGVVKLADFGMAKVLTGQAANLSLKGSPYWMAPELLQSVMQTDDNVELALAVDIWSLGCTIIEMFNGKPPWSEYEGAAAMFKALKESPPIPENLSAEGKEFLRCCFYRNPAERPTAAILLEHRFVNNLNSLDLLSTRSSTVMEFTDKEKSQRTLLAHKLDQVLALSDTETSKREIC